MFLYKNAVSLLQRDFIRNYCILELLKKSKKHNITIIGNSVLIKLLDDEKSFTLISSAQREEGFKLVENL